MACSCERKAATSTLTDRRSLRVADGAAPPSPPPGELAGTAPCCGASSTIGCLLGASMAGLLFASHGPTTPAAPPPPAAVSAVALGPPLLTLRGPAPVVALLLE